MALMPSRNVRLLTSLAVIGICIWPVWKGLDVTRFAMAGSQTEAVRPWGDDSGVAFAAREDALTSTNDSSDDATIRKRRDEIAQILAIKPLSSYYWIQLAESRVDAHEPIAKTLDALELSEVTGPNEEYMITQRGLFGIWQWEVLPPDVRQRAIADLVAGSLSDTKLAWLKKTLAEKPEPVRQEIRSALQAQGFSQSNFNRIGL
jgi:hypothetical protein